MPAEKPSIRQGMRLPLPDKSNFFRLSYWRRVVLAVNAFLNFQAKPGSQFDFQISDHNAVLTIPNTGESSTTTSSGTWTITEPSPGTADWLNIQVAPGYVTLTPLPGWPNAKQGSAAIGPDQVTNFSADIACPSGESSVIVYLDLHTTPGSGILKAEATDDGSWFLFGVTDPEHFVIGIVDTTNTTDQVITIRQLINCNTLIATDRATNAFNAIIPTIELFDPFNSLDYSTDQSLVRGTVANGFPSNGLYLFVGAGAGVGPDSAWFKA